MQIYNTLTRRKELFKPQQPGKVRMYVCGPTVYDYIHIGNARPMVVFDTLHRYFRYLGYEVQYVVNFTDIDDKIINKARAEGVDFHQISENYIQAFEAHAKGLNLLEEETDHPRCTDHMEEIIAFIQGLVDQGAAYDAADAVYFDVSSYPNYGQLSGKRVEDLRAGARISVNEAKDDPVDFALWKKQKDPDEPAWDSPWGPGRPGWHIECSTMSGSLLGETLDIHAGGADLEFPHHENERAQSERLHGATFANYWMHNGMITVSNQAGETEKMSKSLGNSLRLNEVEQAIDLMAVRLWLLSTHYRAPINYAPEVLDQALASYKRLINAKHEMERYLAHAEDRPRQEADEALLSQVKEAELAFKRAMEDDLNTADALTALYEISKLANGRMSEANARETIASVLTVYQRLLEVMGIADRPQEDQLDEAIDQLIQERNEARKQKDYARADAIRDQLLAQGIVLKDTSTGVVWERKA